MVVIVASLGAMLFIWSNATYGSVESSTGSFFSAQAQQSQERYTVEQVWFQDLNGNGLKDRATLYVRNVGSLSVTLVNIYVNGTQINANSTIVGPSQVVPVTITLSPEIQVNKMVVLVAVTQRGNSVPQNWIVS